jgi:hypothetical protein
MKWCPATLACLLSLGAVHAHEGGIKNQKPTKAARHLKSAEKKLQAARKELSAKGKYTCCVKPGCGLCLRAKGACDCAASIDAGTGVCGECLAGWRAGRGSVRGVNGAMVCHRPVATPQTLLSTTPPLSDAPESLEESNEQLLQAKRILVKEKRYFCCIRGGCAECAMEADCLCGSDLARDAAQPGKAESRRGVCGHCYDGWHGGLGSFPSVQIAEVQLAEMDSMTAAMSPDSSPSSGWYASGTAQIPRAAPYPMLHKSIGNWSLMFQGQLFAVHTNQTGPRGREKFFASNWFMPMASRRVGRGTFTIRSMFSLDPATVTHGRYPLLFQEGETWKGVPILNGQHPHDFVMELGAAYQYRLGERTTVQIYGGPRGEPALGPPAFLHRVSQSENPMAVLGHHFQDSTHIANNVISAGISHGPATFEISGFHGREPDEKRWGLEGGAIDSLSARITLSPTPRWTGQFSIGRINNREATHPFRDSFRQTASVTYVRPHATGYWASTILWGRNHDLAFTQLPVTSTGADAAASKGGISAPGAKRFHRVLVPTRIPGQIYNSYGAESTLLWKNRNWFWGRAELADKDSLLLFREEPLVTLVEEQRYTRVRAFTMGYSRELPAPAPMIRPALGSQITINHSPPNLAAIYGPKPVGIQVFLRIRFAAPIQ